MISQPRLVLFPQQAESSRLDPSRIFDHLLALGMTGEVVPGNKSLLLPGPEFMSLITFLGCSPTVSNATSGETQSANHYFIEVTSGNDRVVSICGSLPKAPRCPQCKQSAPDWNELPDAGETELACATCEYRAPSADWDWRHLAGFGRQWINIWGVHEGEAVPGEKLLNSFQDISGIAWDYAWCKQQSL